MTHSRSSTHRRSGRTAVERIRAGLLAENVAGLERLAADGWTEAWHAPRLIRGDALAWDPERDLGAVQLRARLT